MIEGVVTIVQESRFQLTDDAGVGHLFTVGHACGAEPGQLAQLQRRQARVRVRYTAAPNAIGNVAHTIWVA
jgi:hypothetical protein